MHQLSFWIVLGQRHIEEPNPNWTWIIIFLLVSYLWSKFISSLYKYDERVSTIWGAQVFSCGSFVFGNGQVEGIRAEILFPPLVNLKSKRSYVSNGKLHWLSSDIIMLTIHSATAAWLICQLNWRMLKISTWEYLEDVCGYWIWFGIVLQGTIVHGFPYWRLRN